MLVRKHSYYAPRFAWDDAGFLLITKTLILATGRYARVWK